MRKRCSRNEPLHTRRFLLRYGPMLINLPYTVGRYCRRELNGLRYGWGNRYHTWVFNRPFLS